eukprot:3560271-Karenia_brevis.AAC.1
MVQKRATQQMYDGLAKLRTIPNVIPTAHAHNFVWVHELSEDIGAPFAFKSGQFVTTYEDISIFTSNIWAHDFKATEEHMKSLDVQIVEGKIPCGKRIGPLKNVSIVVLDNPEASMGITRHALVGMIEGSDAWYYNFPESDQMEQFKKVISYADGSLEAYFLLGTSDKAFCMQTDWKGAVAWNSQESTVQHSMRKQNH